MITVEHRNDRMLQKLAAQVVPAEYSDMFIARVTIPTSGALVAFLENEKNPIIGEHADFKNLQMLLDMWPEFAYQFGIKSLAHEYESIEIDKSLQVLSTPGGMGGEITVAKYQLS